MERMSFSLLEVIEQPRRLNSLPSTAIFEYAREAANTNKERFYSFITAIGRLRPWALSAIVLASSDVIPLKEIFKEALANKQLHNFQQGALTIQQAVTQLFEALKFDRLSTESAKLQFAKRLESNLPADDLELFYQMLAQEGFKKVREKMAELYKDKTLPAYLEPYFSFCYSDKEKLKEEAGEIRGQYASFKSIRRLAKIFGLFFDEKGVQYHPTKDVIKTLRAVHPFVRKTEEVPDVCFLYLSEDELPVMVATPKSFYVLVNPKNVRLDNTLSKDIAKGARYLVEVDSNFNVSSFSNFENKAMEEVKVNVESHKWITFPYLGDKVTILYLTTKEGSDIPVIVPEGTCGDMSGTPIDEELAKKSPKLTLVRYKGDHFLQPQG